MAEHECPLDESPPEHVIDDEPPTGWEGLQMSLTESNRTLGEQVRSLEVTIRGIMSRLERPLDRLADIEADRVKVEATKAAASALVAESFSRLVSLLERLGDWKVLAMLVVLILAMGWMAGADPGELADAIEPLLPGHDGHGGVPASDGG